MGLFSFLKKAGANVLTNKAAKAVRTPEIIAMEAEILRKQKLMLLNGVVSGMKSKIKNFEIDLNDDRVTVYGQAPSMAIKEKVILALGNVGGIASVDDRISVVKPAPESIFHEVKKGDTLGKIAKHYYGDAKKYTKIFNANKPMLKDPNKIFPGQKLRIPK